MQLKKKKIFLFTILLIIGYLVYFVFSLNVKAPKIENTDALLLQVEQINDSISICDDSWLKLNDKGLWEMYVSGSPFELGVKAGKLTQELNYYQEKAFVDRLKEMIPSEKYLTKLKYGIAFFNRNMEKHVPLENQQEIYGYAQYASNDYDFIAPNYHRMLNYHGAHDIGHALQNLNLVACTAFAVWDERSTDSSLIIARNFDFYMGEDFARNKIIAFYKPDNGYAFMTITWAGMTGVVSGMNTHGLTITLNSAKSEIPFSAKTPVSILARNILQHAKNIDEAYEIANSAETFVSESFLIGSAEDRKAVVIEKSPSKIDIYESGKSELILTNHFQGEIFKNTKRTLRNIAESASYYRYLRVDELLSNKEKHNVNSLAKILRNPYGLEDKNIGYGNEKAINQFIAHHGIIFKPEQKQVWIATHPYQLGEMLMYDLNKIFSKTAVLNENIYKEIYSVKSDTFLQNKKYKNFINYRELTEQYLKDCTTKLSPSQIEEYIQLNNKYYYSYFVAANKHLQNGDTTNAISCLKQALKCEIPRKVDKEQVAEELNSIKNTQNNKIHKK